MPLSGVDHPEAPIATPDPTPTPAPTAERTPRATATPAPRARRPTHNLKGTATWYATGRDGMYGAAGPELRHAIGKGWRGSIVLVCQLHGRVCVNVRLIDWCRCTGGAHRLIDLSDEAYAKLARLSSGVTPVAVGY